MPWPTSTSLSTDFWPSAKECPRDLRQARLHIFHTLDLLFCPNNANERHCKTPNLIKKLRLSNADWTTRKKLLGWMVLHFMRCLISLPAER